MNLSTCETNTTVCSYDDMVEKQSKDLAIISCFALLSMHEVGEVLTLEQGKKIKTCLELIDSELRDENETDEELVALCVKHIDDYFEAREQQKKYFCADSTKAAQPIH